MKFRAAIISLGLISPIPIQVKELINRCADGMRLLNQGTNRFEELPQFGRLEHAVAVAVGPLLEFTGHPRRLPVCGHFLGTFTGTQIDHLVHERPASLPANKLEVLDEKHTGTFHLIMVGCLVPVKLPFRF